MDNSDSPLTVVFIDADNTLWDTDGVYADAQLSLLHGVEDCLGIPLHEQERLAFVRSIDQGLAERHHAGLRYPPRFLIKALALALTGANKASAIRLAWSGGIESNRLTSEAEFQLESRLMDDLRKIPDLRPGVRVGLPQMDTQDFPKLVLTEGKKERVQNLVRAHGLERYISRVIESRKDQRFYERLMRLFHPSNAGFMIGDQLQRDIRPAKAAGLRTVYYPSKFRPKWEIQEADVRPDHQVSSFEEVPAIIERAMMTHS